MVEKENMISSSYTTSATYPDGRVRVREKHLDEDGIGHVVDYRIAPKSDFDGILVRHASELDAIRLERIASVQAHSRGEAKADVETFASLAKSIKLDNPEVSAALAVIDSRLGRVVR